MSDEPAKPHGEEPSERSALLDGQTGQTVAQHPRDADGRSRERSLSAFRERLRSVDATHLSPATPLLDAPKPSDPPATRNIKPTSTLQAFVFNTFAIILVCAAGALGWWVSVRSDRHGHQGGGETGEERQRTLEFDLWGQIFGYLCAVLYLGSRVPQLLLNWRRKSTEGVSLLFFLFACIGNLTYVLSIFAYSPICYRPRECRPGEAGAIYGRYILVNASWLLGSFGTLLLDMGIFVQFFLYRPADEDWSEGEEATARLDNVEDRGRSANER